MQPAGRGFDIVYDTTGGASLDASFKAIARFGDVLSSLGWGTHALAPLSFRAATYSGMCTLLPLPTGEGKVRHGEIMREATRLLSDTFTGIAPANACAFVVAQCIGGLAGLGLARCFEHDATLDQINRKSSTIHPTHG